MRQRGAIFGLDIRMAIVLGGLMAAAISAEMLTDFEGDRQTKTERKLESVRDALLHRYQTSTTSTFSTTLTNLYTGGFMLHSDTAYYAVEAPEQEAVDGWGENLTVSVVSTTKTILGASVPVHFGILVSSGPDRIFQSVTSLANENAYLGWVPAGDDIGIKFNTVLIERDRTLLMQNQLKRIMEALTAYAQKTETTFISTCSATTCSCLAGSPSICGFAIAYCDKSGDGYYCAGEEKMYNFYPTDAVEAVMSSTPSYAVARSQTTYTSANVASMQAMMSLIGLPTTFATDPWGRTLNYKSNEYSNTAAPFAASVWYQ